MGIINCKKIVAGVFTFSSLFEIKMKVFSHRTPLLPFLHGETKIQSSDRYNLRDLNRHSSLILCDYPCKNRSDLN